MNKPAIQRCLEHFCDLVLVDDDTLEFTPQIQAFIASWTRAVKADPDSFFGAKTHTITGIDLEELLQNIVHDYELGCKKCAPYSFFSSLNNFRKEFIRRWTNRCIEISVPEEYHALPYELIFAFMFIQQRCGFFDAIKIYTNVSESNINNQIDRRIKNLTETVAKVAKSIIDTVEKDVNDAKNEIDCKVADSANESSRKMAEASVTVLGIFSGIILTLAGVFSFSSVVLENLNASNFYRLLIVISIIGMIFAGVFLGLFYFLYNVRHNIKVDMPEEEKKHIKQQENKLLIPIILVEISFVLLVCYVLGYHSEDLKKNTLGNETLAMETSTTFETQASVPEATSSSFIIETTDVEPTE